MITLMSVGSSSTFDTVEVIRTVERSVCDVAVVASSAIELDLAAPGPWQVTITAARAGAPDQDFTLVLFPAP